MDTPVPANAETAKRGNTILSLDRQGKKITLIGLADHSAQSLAEADRILTDLNPDVVCLELCETRRMMLEDKSYWEEATIWETLRNGRGLLLLANLGAATWLGRHGLGDLPRPGKAMLERKQHAESLGAQTHMSDRDMHITLRRAWHVLSTKRKAGLIFRLLRSLVPWQKKKQVASAERPQQEMVHIFSQSVPEVKSVILEESDRYFWSSIHNADGNTVAAVMDVDRLDGLLNAAEQDIDREALHTEPPRGRFPLGQTLFMTALISAVIFLLVRRDGELPIMDVIWAWVLPNSLLTAGFAAIGGARIRSMLVGALVAPFTPLSLAIRSGIWVGLTEVWLRKPLVRDFETVPQDIKGLNTLYKNRMTRVLLVAWLAHAGSSLGNYLGLFLVIKALT